MNFRSLWSPNYLLDRISASLRVCEEIFDLIVYQNDSSILLAINQAQADVCALLDTNAFEDRVDAFMEYLDIAVQRLIESGSIKCINKYDTKTVVARHWHSSIRDLIIAYPTIMLPIWVIDRVYAESVSRIFGVPLISSMKESNYEALLEVCESISEDVSLAREWRRTFVQGLDA